MSKEQRLELYKIVAIMLLVPIVCGLIFSNISFALDNFIPSYNVANSLNFNSAISLEPKLWNINNSDVGIVSSNDYPVYTFVSSDNVYFCSEYSGATVRFIYYNNSVNSRTISTYSSTYNLYYVAGTVSASSFYIPQYSNFELGLEALRDYLDNGSSSETSPFYDDLPDFNIQRGYAAYIDFGADWQGRSISGQLISEFPQYSSLISGDWDGTDNRRYAWASALPSNTNFASNYGSAIDWTKVEPFDLLKRSKRGIWFIQSSTPQNRYLVIVNPNMWRYGQNASDDTLNRPITVHNLSGSAGEVKFYALNQTFDSEGTLVNSGSEDGTNNINGVYDPNTGSFNETDLNGNIATQTPGGNSDTPSINSVSDYIAQIGTILSNFANNLLSLIQKPISHIGTLIQGGSEFMSALRGLYSWLPVDIQAIIISALTVVIAIGVFKVFL